MLQQPASRGPADPASLGTDPSVEASTAEAVNSPAGGALRVQVGTTAASQPLPRSCGGSTPPYLSSAAHTATCSCKQCSCCSVVVCCNTGHKMVC